MKQIFNDICQKTTYYGMIIKFNRKKKGLVLEELSDMSNISVAHINKIENRTENGNFNTFQDLMRVLEVEYNETPCFELFEKLNLVYRKILLMDYENAKSVFESLSAESYTNSNVIAFYLVLKFVLSVHAKESDHVIKKKYQFLKKYESSMHVFEKQLLNHYWGLHKSSQKKHEEALIFIERAQEVSVDVSENALIQCHKSLILSRLGYHFEAIDSLKLAIESFDVSKNIRRSLYASIQLCSEYGIIGQHQYAIDGFRCIIDHCDQTIFEDIINFAYINLIWTYGKTSDWNSLKKTVEEYVVSNGMFEAEARVYYSWALYKSRGLEHAIHYIRQNNLSLVTRKQYSRLIELMVSLFDEKSSHTIKYIDKQLVHATGDLKELLLYEKVKILEEEGDYQSAYYTLNSIIQMKNERIFPKNRTS